ncbi:MAG: hypothetical protein ACRDRK_16925, partial [Pseudonocardia sp.]
VPGGGGAATARLALSAEAADAAGLPADPEFRSAFIAYVEWGSRTGRRTRHRHDIARRGTRAALGMGRGTGAGCPRRAGWAAVGVCPDAAQPRRRSPARASG